MKTIRFMIVLFLASLLLPACAPQIEWATYRAETDTVVNPNFPPYSFDYPSDWVMEEGVNHITFVSNTGLLNEVPQKMEAGEIIVSMSMNISMPPEEMVEVDVPILRGVVEFDETVSFALNGRPAASIEGTEIGSNDQIFSVAVDMGDNMRGLLSAQMAEGELDLWRDALIKMAESLRVDG
jgi:hypothetical protein